MQVAGQLYGGAAILKRIKAGATFANPGVITIDGVGVALPSTTTDFADSLGLALDTTTYSTTQGAPEAAVTVNVRGDGIIRALMSGGATENTALTLLASTAASAGGVLITDADVGAADMVSGTLWATSGSNFGQSRIITAHTASTSMAVTVPFPYAVAIGDEFLFCPWSLVGSGAAGSDGVSAVQATAAFTQANAAIASGTGGVADVVDLELNGPGDSYVQFCVSDHIHRVDTV
jgi:hypothetical protein